MVLRLQGYLSTLAVSIECLIQYHVKFVPTMLSAMRFPRLHRISLLWRLWHVISRIFLNHIDVLHQVNLFGVQPFRLLIELPENEQDREDTNHGIREEESWNAPLSGQKDGIASNKGHDETPGERVPCEVRLEAALVG